MFISSFGDGGHLGAEDQTTSSTSTSYFLEVVARAAGLASSSSVAAVVLGTLFDDVVAGAELPAARRLVGDVFVCASN